MEKRILILSDLVGRGDVAMSTSRAVLTRMGHQAYCLPTALISNTWNFGSCAQLTTTDYLRASLEAWEKLDFRFDGVLLGYLADQAQAQWLGEQCQAWHRAGISVFLDPVFADDGRLYRGVTRERLTFLGKLLKQVDFVLPNLTEARFLTGQTDPLEALEGLRSLGAKCAVITGVPWGEESAVLLAAGEGTDILPYVPVDGKFPGAGDAFTALFTGGILSGRSPRESAQIAVETTRHWICQSAAEGRQSMGLPVERYF